MNELTSYRIYFKCLFEQVLHIGEADLVRGIRDRFVRIWMGLDEESVYAETGHPKRRISTREVISTTIRP